MNIFIFILTSTVNAQNFTVDTEKSDLKWTGKKVTGQHHGSIELTEGSFTLNDNRISKDLKEQKPEMCLKQPLMLTVQNTTFVMVQASFFENLGDNMIYDDFILDITLVTNKEFYKKEFTFESQML